jgi:hypothetical protein
MELIGLLAEFETLERRGGGMAYLRVIPRNLPETSKQTT